MFVWWRTGPLFIKDIYSPSSTIIHEQVHILGKQSFANELFLENTDPKFLKDSNLLYPMLIR